MIENIDKLDFNRKVDVLVAIHVFGVKDIIVREQQWDYMGESGVVWIVFLPTGTHVSCYSVLLTSAWDIVRKFDYLYLFRSKDFRDKQWECKLIWDDDDTSNYGWAETEQLAICYAGLKAVGFDLESFLKEEGKG